MQNKLLKRRECKTELEWERDSWNAYLLHLPPPERPYFKQIWDSAFLHDQKRLTGDRVVATDHLWMGVFIEQQKLLNQHQRQIDALEQRLKDL